MTENQLIIAYLASNIVAIALLFTSLKKKNLTRVLFAILFIWAACINWYTARNNPADYLNYDKYALGFYKNIIHGGFSKHITAYVSMIAVGQLLIGLGLLSRGIVVKVSCIGGIIFLLAISGLGIGAAFPFSLPASAALFFLYKYHFEKDILKNKWWV